MTTLSLLQAATAGQWINLIFRPRRYQLTAASYRHARDDAFSPWANYTAEIAP
jgi:putative transposase